MGDINKQAEELNNTIKKANNTIFGLLSEKGKKAFFPKKGILAQAADAKGKAINATIGIGLEDDGDPLCLNCIADKISIPKKDAFPYAPSYGKKELRLAWKKQILKKNPSINSEISTPIVTNALTHGLSIIGHLFIDPEDNIIIPDRFWGNYKLIFDNSYDANLITFNTFKDQKLDLESLKKTLENENKKKILILNFPNNPSGYTPTEKEANKIIEIIKKSAINENKLLVILDDAYFGLVYEDGILKESLFSGLCNLHENVLAIKIDGTTKEDFVWGFRIGFITYGTKNADPLFYKALEDKTAGAIRGNISNASHLSQSLILAGINSDEYENEKKEKNALLKSRYEEVKNTLSEHKYSRYFHALPYNSGYFMCIKLKDHIDAEAIRKILLDEYDTGVIAIGALLRIAYSSVSKDKIKNIFENIYEACRRYEDGYRKD